MKYAVNFCLPLCFTLAAAAQQPDDQSPQPPRMGEFTSVEAFRTHFNSDVGVPRLLLLLSPTCPKCIEGAEWVDDNLFKAYPDAPLRTYVVWMRVLPTDRRERIPQKLLMDERTEHYWDEERQLGGWLKENSDCPSLEPVAWDAYYLFAKDTLWDGEGLPSPVSCGTPIFQRTVAFERALESLLEPDGSDEAATTIEVFGIPDCPNFAATVERVRAAAETALPEAVIRTVIIADDATARELRLPGSPTVLINGRDIAPIADGTTHHGLACRLYDGAPMPSKALLRAAFVRHSKSNTAGH